MNAKTMNPVSFYSEVEAYGDFSNFAPFAIVLKGREWPTAEHYFQAQKFPGTEHEEAIRRAPSPMAAAQLGRSRSQPLRAGWEAMKEAVMREALRAKFTQHPELADRLLATGETGLVEHARNDAYWGDGGDGTGRNRLGHLLMELRAQLREEREHGGKP